MSDMGDTVDTAGATEAIASYFAAADSGEPTYEEQTAPEDLGEANETQESNEAPTDDDLGPDPDLSDLDPAQRAFLETRIKQLRQVMTEKTTKAADAMRVLELAGGNAQEIQDAYEFAQALQNDPAVRAQLLAALQAESGNQPEPTAPTEDPFSEYDLPPEIKDRLSKVDQLEQRFAALDAREAEHEAKVQRDAYVQEVVDDLTDQYGKITAAYPDLLGDSAEEAKAIEEEIFALGASTGGDLGLALDIFRSIEARAQNRLVDGAARVPGGSVTPPRGAGHSTEPPAPIETFKEAGAAALEYMQQFQQD